MEILKVIALLLGAAILLTSCSVYGKKELTYQKGAFRAEIEWESDGTKFSASVTAGAPRPPAEGEDIDSVIRDIEMCFLSPESMRGIKVTRTNGEVGAALGDIEIDSGALAGYLAAADLFDVSGEVKDIELVDSESGRLTRIDVRDGDAEFSVYLSVETENPVRLTGSKYDVKVVWFER